MAIKKIQISDVLKRHLKIVGYLVVSAAIAYVASILADKPEFIYFAPVVNYVLFVLEKELKSEGVVQIIKSKVNGG